MPVEHALAALRTCDRPTRTPVFPQARATSGFVTAAIHNLRLRAPPLAGHRSSSRRPFLQAWADAVNAPYELGIFIVTVAGNNFGNLPTRNIVYPARFKRWWWLVGDGRRRPYDEADRITAVGAAGTRAW